MFRHLFICLLSILVFTTGFIEARAINGSKTVVQQGQDVNNNEEFQGIQGADESQNEVHEYRREMTKIENAHLANRRRARNSTETFKKALIGGVLGANRGIQAFEAGTSIIKSATEPFVHNGRSYNWDNRGKVKSDEYQCWMPLGFLVEQQSNTSMNSTLASTNGSTPSLDQVLQIIQYQNGSRPEKIVWTCKSQGELCCGVDCCPPPPTFYVSYEYNSDGFVSSIIGVMFFLLWTFFSIIVCLFPFLLCAGCCFAVFSVCFGFLVVGAKEVGLPK